MATVTWTVTPGRREDKEDKVMENRDRRAQGNKNQQIYKRDQRRDKRREKKERTEQRGQTETEKKGREKTDRIKRRLEWNNKNRNNKNQ